MNVEHMLISTSCLSSYARRKTQTNDGWSINHQNTISISSLMRILFVCHKSKTFMIVDRYYFLILIISTLLSSNLSVRIIFLPSKIIIIAARKVLMVTETKLKVTMRPKSTGRGRVSWFYILPNADLHLDVYLTLLSFFDKFEFEILFEMLISHHFMLCLSLFRLFHI